MQPWKLVHWLQDAWLLQHSFASKQPHAAPLQVLKGNEAFVVEPLSGVVPANGQAYVNVTFTPLAFRTEEMLLQVGAAAGATCAAALVHQHASAPDAHDSLIQPRCT